MTAVTTIASLTAANMRFDDIIAPIAESDFFASYYDRKPVHIPAAAESATESATGSATSHRFDEIMNWGRLNDLLNITPIWHSKSLLMVLDTKNVPVAAYCEETDDRYGNRILIPQSEKVMGLLEKGAALVANEIDSLTPELRALSIALEQAFTGKAQINLYCSWARHKAFKSHFDTHDVMALQIAGEKTWRVYENRMPHPVRHRRFGNETYTDRQHDQQKGAVLMEVTMRPGDVLYLPRGWYHDALADSPGSIHLACGITGIVGFDMIDALSDVAADQEDFRRSFPRYQDGEAALNSHIDDLRDTLSALLDSPGFRQAFRAFQLGFRTPRGGMALPVAVAEKRYSLTGQGFEIQQIQGRQVLSGPKGKVPIPPPFVAPTTWVIEVGTFTRSEFLGQSFSLDIEQADKALIQLVTMGVINSTDENE